MLRGRLVGGASSPYADGVTLEGRYAWKRYGVIGLTIPLWKEDGRAAFGVVGLIMLETGPSVGASCVSSNGTGSVLLPKLAVVAVDGSGFVTW